MEDSKALKRINPGKNYGSPIRRELVRKLRQGWITTRQDAVKILGLAPSTAGDYISQLVEADIISEERVSLGRVGRPIQKLSLNPQAGNFIGLDFEATTVMVQVVDFACQPVYRERRQLPRKVTVERMLEEVISIIESTVALFPDSVRGIGVGIPGLVDFEKGLGLAYEHIRGWKNVAVQEILQNAFSLPVTISNTGRSGALAEQIFGQARQVTDFVNVVIRGGIGAGIVERGHFVTGAFEAAGEIGHVLVFDAVQKKLRPIEQFATAQQLYQKAGIGDAANRWKQFEELVREKNPSVLEAMDNAEQAIGQLLGMLAAALNPQRIIIQSPLVGLGEAFRTRLERKMARQLKVAAAAQPDVVFSELGFFAGALGAATLAVDAWEPAIQ